jgi:cation diffusion facilitator family transporter
MSHPAAVSPSLTRYAWLSIAAALLTIALKAVAYYLTGSVGLLSDAMESVVNLAGALMALAMLTIAARPADEAHAYGHGKAEYFSSGVEGSLILIAAVSIGYTAVQRLLAPQPLEQLGVGLAVSVVASLINLGVALVLRRVGKQHRSITLEADAHHLLTDVWTSVGVLLGVALVGLTGWLWLDPVVALLVAANIVWAGLGILRRSVAGLMDPAQRHGLHPHRAAGGSSLLGGYGVEPHRLDWPRNGNLTPGVRDSHLVRSGVRVDPSIWPRHMHTERPPQRHARSMKTRDRMETGPYFTG